MNFGWEDILNAYEEGKFYLYDYGLTMRLIVGACQEPIEKKFDTEQEAFNRTKSLFEEMSEYEVDGHIVVSNQCDANGGPVFRFSEQNWTPTALGVSFEEIWNKYGQDIIAGNFNISAHDQEVLEGIKQ